MEYKRVLCQTEGFFTILVSLLAEPLSKTRRSEQEHLTIEIVLHLFRNVLAIQPVVHQTDNDKDTAAAVHYQLVQVLEQELVLDILCVLAADLDQPHSPNAAYNLLLMEILQHLVLPFPVDHVITAVNHSPKSNENNQDKSKSNNQTKTGLPSSTSTTTQTKASASYKPTTGGSGGTSSSAGGSLRNALLRERQSVQSHVTARHGNFGGQLVLEGERSPPEDENTKEDATTTTTNWTVSTTQYAQSTLGVTHNMAIINAASVSNKRTPVFLGALPSRAKDSCSGGSSGGTTPMARKACTVIGRFGQRFLADCFAPWAKSLKNEFRRDSVRLEDGDRVVWLQLVAYWSRLWRGLKVKPKQKSAFSSSIGPLLFTMDVFSFHLVHNAADTFTQHKEYGKLAYAVSLLKEMMILLQILYDSKDETEQIMAMGLLDRLFYGSEPLDRLPKLLSLWQPGQASHTYAADLVELVHTQIKLLERHAEACAALADPQSTKYQRKKKKESGTTDTITKMKMAAADFDVAGYVRKLCTPHNVFLYTQLLAKYDVNSPRLNHRVVSFLLRVAQFPIVVPEHNADEAGNNLQNPLVNTRTITLEPMLYNIRLLSVLHGILNDVAAIKDKHLQIVVQFAIRIVSHFAQLAEENPLLLVEALVKHPSAHRHCEAVMTHYVSEELVMLAERDLLLEEQNNWDEEDEEGDYPQGEGYDDDGEHEGRPSLHNRTSHNRSSRNPQNHKNNDDDDDSDSDGEIEFDGGLVEGVSKPTENDKTKRKAIVDDDDDDSDDEVDGDKGDDDNDQNKNNNITEDTPESPSKKQRTSNDEEELDRTNKTETSVEESENDSDNDDPMEIANKDSASTSASMEMKLDEVSKANDDEDNATVGTNEIPEDVVVADVTATTTAAAEAENLEGSDDEE
jgi:timeless